MKLDCEKKSLSFDSKESEVKFEHISFLFEQNFSISLKHLYLSKEKLVLEKNTKIYETSTIMRRNFFIMMFFA
ncbi:MAG: hypothetical protein HQM10_18470 [Candidatus Riflebacteria bacterium]|nr:hypothetical protein [Candidatus Riflebacteria bacterium]